MCSSMHFLPALAPSCPCQVGAALAISGVTLGYVGKLATKAVADVEKETAEEVAAEAADRAAADAAADATTGGQE